MTIKEAILIVICFCLWFFTLLLHGVNCEFRWMWLQIVTTLALPIVLTLLLFKRLLRIKSIWAKLILISISVLGVLYLAVLGIFSLGSTIDAKQYSFVSPNKQHEIIVKEYHAALLDFRREFYSPAFLVLKKKMDTDHHSIEASQPLDVELYVAEWSKNNMECTIRWNYWNPKLYIGNEMIRFN